jgi:muramoyltetrapeptide carboxypeptidase
MSKYWTALKEHDIVDIVAPGSATTSEELASACRFIESWNLKPRVTENLFSGHPYLSHQDDFRFQDLKRALYARDSKLVWCLRGGYGSIRLLPKLLKLKKPSRNKLFLGYSDMTTIHLFLSQKWQWISCHGPLLDAAAKNKYPAQDMLELKSILMGQQSEVVFSSLQAVNAMARKVKKLKASSFAANLMTLVSHSGTAMELKGRKQILFLEEINERGYRLDRLLQQFLQTKSVKGLSAIVLGDFLGGQEPNGQNHVARTLQEFSEQVKIPIFSGAEVGHGERNRPVFSKVKSELSFQGSHFVWKQTTGVKN